MDYLAKDGAPVSAELWERIGNTVTENAKSHMVCRRFLSLYGPLGAGVFHVPVDSNAKTEETVGSMVRVSGRRLAELPQLVSDFAILGRDIEAAAQSGFPLDLAPAAAAAQKSAKLEDDLILFGDKALGAEGLFTAQGAERIKRGDWAEGENAFQDVARAIAYMAGNNYLGRYALIASPEVYLQMQRLQQSVGMLELDRVKSLVGGRVYPAGVYGAGKAALVCAEPQYMDLAVGLDLSVGYLEQKEFNHFFRITETVALRIKDPKAIVHFE